MPTITDPAKLADAIDDAANCILRWGHAQMRQLPLSEKEMIVAALRAFRPEEREQEYVAWLVINDHGGRRPATIHVADSDTPGAFKVWRCQPQDDSRSKT